MIYLSVPVILALLANSPLSATNSTQTDIGEVSAVRIANGQQLHYTNSNGEITPDLFRVSDDQVELHVEFSRFQSRQTGCVITIKYVNRKSFIATYIPETAGQKHKLDFGDLCYNNDHADPVNLYEKHVDDPGLATCFELEKHSAKGLSNIERVLESSDSPILSEVRRDIARRGVSLLLYKYPFKHYTPQMIVEINKSDQQRGL